MGKDVFAAIKKGNLKTIQKALESGIGINGRDADGLTMLHHAAQLGNTEIVEFLLNNGAPIDTKDNLGRTPLFMAISAGKEILAFLLVRRGANPNVTTNSGISIMEKAKLLGPSFVSRLNTEIKSAQYNIGAPRTTAGTDSESITVQWGTRTIRVADTQRSPRSNTLTSSDAPATPPQPPQSAQSSQPSPAKVESTSDRILNSMPTPVFTPAAVFTPTLTPTSPPASSPISPPPASSRYSTLQGSVVVNAEPRPIPEEPIVGRSLKANRPESVYDAMPTIPSDSPFAGPSTINLDEMTESLCAFAQAVAVNRFGGLEFDRLNTALRPLVNSLRGFFRVILDGVFTSNLPPDLSKRVWTIAREIKNELEVSVLPAFRDFYEGMNEENAGRSLKNATRALIRAFYELLICCESAQHSVSAERSTLVDIGPTVHECARRTKEVMVTALAEVPLAQELDAAIKGHAASVCKLIKLVHFQSCLVVDAVAQQKLSDTSYTISRASEGLYVAASSLIMGSAGEREGVVEKLKALGKLLAEQFMVVVQQFKAFGDTRGATVTGFSEKEVYTACAAQLKGASSRLSNLRGSLALPTEQFAIDSAQDMAVQIELLRDALSSFNRGDMMVSARFIAGEVTQLASNLLNSYSNATANGERAQQLLDVFNGVLYFGMATKLAASARALDVSLGNNLIALPTSLRGLSATVALAVESKLL